MILVFVSFNIGSVDDAFDAVRGMLANRADQGGILADQIQTDVVAMLRAMLQQHAAVQDSVRIDAQSYDQQQDSDRARN